MHLIIIIAYASLLWFNSDRSTNLLGLTAMTSITIVAAQTAVLLAATWWLTRRSLAALQADPDDPNEAQHRHHVYTMIIQTALVTGFAASLILTAWPMMIRGTLGRGLTFGLADLLVLSPFLLNLMAVWIIQYPADRAIRQIAQNPRLAGGHPTHPVWSLPQYLSFNLRYQLLTIAVPMTLIIVGDDVIDHFRSTIRAATGNTLWASDALMGLVVSGVFVFAPVMLRFIWTTEPLPAGELRTTLERVARQMDLTYRDILVWHSQGMVVNAAVMGVLAPMRYVLISDGLLESMSDRHIEAVFGHEAGHVRCWHIPYFILFATLTMLIAGGLMQALYAYGPPALRPYAQVIVGAVVILLWGVAFGWLSHQFEHQADLAGAMSITPEAADCRQPCRVHSGDARQPGVVLCATAATEFSRALQRVAALNGIPGDERGWRHPSIRQRIRLLQQLSHDAAGTRRFMTRLRVAKVVLIAGTVLGLGLGAWLFHDQLLPPGLAR